MDHLIYTALAGAGRSLEQQAVISNNLANVSTTGFREQLALSRSVPLRGLNGEHATRASSITTTPGSRMQTGMLVETGRSLDVAIQGEGWFVVQTPEGQAYTRAGDFSVNSDGILVNSVGQVIVSEDEAAIEVPEYGDLTFSNDGLLSVIGAGDGARDLQVVGRLKLVNPDDTALVRGDDGLFRLPGVPFMPADDTIRVASGFLEKSNVSAAQAMVGLIANARQFEIQMRMIQDASTNAERANGLLAAGS